MQSPGGEKEYEVKAVAVRRGGASGEQRRVAPVGEGPRGRARARRPARDLRRRFPLSVPVDSLRAVARGPGDDRGEGGSASAASAARALEALVPPLRFALAGGVRAERLAAFGATATSAVSRARASGTPDSPALARLEDEAARFDALPPKERRRALARIAAHLSALIPLPPELQAIARSARIEMLSRRARRSSGGAPRGRRLEAGAERGWPPPPPPPPTPTPRRRPPRASRSGRRPRRRARRPSAPSAGARLAAPLASLPRAHPAPRAQLEERGRGTVEQALEFWPRAYQDRTRVRRIAELRPGEEGIVLGTVGHARVQRMRSGKPMLKVAVTDPTGALELVFFNAPPWRLEAVPAGRHAARVGEGRGRASAAAGR